MEEEDEEMEKKKQCTRNTNFIERKDFIRHYQRNGWMDLSELQAIYSIHIEGTDTLASNGQFRLKDGLSGVGTRISIIKLAPIGT